MTHRPTQLLALLVVLTAAACALGYSQLVTRRATAAAARHDLRDSKQALAEITLASGSSASTKSGNVDITELNRRLRDAASAAGIADNIVSIEPGQPNRIPNTDYSETQVFLRLEPLALQQLVTFLHELATSDRSARAKNIELVTPQAGGNGDTWGADVTMAYLTYSPREVSR